MRALRILQRQGDALSASAQAEVAGGLVGAVTPEGLAGAAARAHAAMEDAGARVLARGALAPACRAGCSYCCHVHADATVPELLAIAAHVTGTWSDEARAALRERLARTVDRVERLDDDARWAARIPCALLDAAGRCTVHAARPLRCRAFHSCSAEPCRDAFEGRAGAPARIALLDRAHAAVEEGYDRALVEAGVSAAAYRLEMGLLVALDDPGAGARWLDGVDPFARARSPSATSA